MGGIFKTWARVKSRTGQEQKQREEQGQSQGQEQKLYQVDSGE